MGKIKQKGSGSRKPLQQWRPTGLSRRSPPPIVGSKDPVSFAHVTKAPRTGKPPVWYVYAWRNGPRIARIEGEQKPVLAAAERDAILRAMEEEKDPPRNKRTVGWLIREWTGWGRSQGPSQSWKDLADSTQKTWSSPLREIDRKWGNVPLTIIGHDRMVEKIYAWRDSRAATPRAADTGIAALRALLDFGIPKGVPRNTADNIPNLYRNGTRADIIWLPEEIERFTRCAAAMAMPTVAYAIRLAVETGLRRADLITVTEDHIDEFRILKQAKKTTKGKQRAWVVIPRFQRLDALIEELRALPRKAGVETLLVDEKGEAWDADRLTKAVRIICDAEGIVHMDRETKKARRKHLHDCRGTFATYLMVEGGLSDAEIADILGWAKERVALVRKLYVDQRAQAMAIGARIQRGFEQRRAL